MLKIPDHTVIIDTPRLVLRAWREEDADALFRLARDPRIGDHAGFQAHPTAEHSLHVIRAILSQPVNFAVVRREDDRVIGSVGYLFSQENNPDMHQGEAELGYWIGMDYQGSGYATETARAMLAYAFSEMGCTRVWCSSYPDNFPSRRVQEKCGFRFHHHAYGVYYSQILAYRDVRYCVVTKDAFEQAVVTPRKNQT